METISEDSEPRFLGGQWSLCAIRGNLSFIRGHPCQRNNRLVWEETQRTVLELFENEWGQKKTVCVDDVLGITVDVRPDLQTHLD